MWTFKPSSAGALVRRLRSPLAAAVENSSKKRIHGLSAAAGPGMGGGKFTPLDHLYKMKPSITPKDEVDSDEEEGDDANMDDFFEDSMLNDADPSLRIGKVLFKAGRSKSKSAIPHPEWFRKQRDEICSYRSTAQIRRCLKSWMVEYDREYQKKFMSLPLQWRKDSPLNEKDTKTTVVYGPEETVAYAHYFMGSRFSVLSVIMSDLAKLMPNFSPKNIVDFGCGPGTGGAAAMTAWPNKVEKYSGVDMSKSMLEAARVVIEGSGQNVGCVLWDKIGDVVKRSETKYERFQLGILAYTLSELSSDAAKQAAVQIMFELLEVGGCLVIVEEGNPRGSHIVRTARQFLLDNFMSNEFVADNITSRRGKDAARAGGIDSDLQPILQPPRGYMHDSIGAKTVAPCTHDKPCPLKNMFCSFNQRVRSSMLRKDNDEKYSYVIITKVAKSGPSNPVTPSKNDNISATLSKYSGVGAQTPDTWLSPPPVDILTPLVTPEIAKQLRSLREQRRAEAKENYLRALQDEEVEDGENDFVQPMDPKSEYEDDEEGEQEEAGSESDESGSDAESENEDEENINEEIFDADDDAEEDDEDNIGSKSELSNRSSSEGLSDIRRPGGLNLTTRNILKQYLMCHSKDDVLNLNDYLLENIDWDEYSPPLYRREWGRVIRSPIKKKGHVIVDSCTSNGFISRSTFSKSNLTHLPSLYTALRKTTWGGLFPASVKFDSDENDESLLKLKNKSNPKPGTFKFSKDYIPGGVAAEADSGKLKVDMKERAKEIRLASKALEKGETSPEEVPLGRAKRAVPRRGQSGFSISSLTSIDQSQFDSIVGNKGSSISGGKKRAEKSSAEEKAVKMDQEDMSAEVSSESIGRRRRGRSRRSSSMELEDDE